jgi:hypothetical protein
MYEIGENCLGGNSNIIRLAASERANLSPRGCDIPDFADKTRDNIGNVGCGTADLGSLTLDARSYLDESLIKRGGRRSV